MSIPNDGLFIEGHSVLGVRYIEFFLGNRVTLATHSNKPNVPERFDWQARLLQKSGNVLGGKSILVTRRDQHEHVVVVSALTVAQVKF